MARGVNKAILVGNLGADPETRHTAAGNPVTKFRLATSESWRDRQTEQLQERTEWHRVVCFGRLAEIASEYLHKGSKVYIEGNLRTDSWEGQDGVKRWTTEIHARELQMLDSRGTRDRDAAFGPMPDDNSYSAGHSRSASDPDQAPSADDGQRQGSTAETAAKAANDDMDDDIPF